MKFIKFGDIQSEYELFEDTRNPDETSKPRWIPSYYDYIKKHNPATSKTKSVENANSKIK